MRSGRKMKKMMSQFIMNEDMPRRDDATGGTGGTG
jgi:hypothetical protein